MIAIACALYFEAKPIIDKFKLKQDTGAKGFKVYLNNEYVVIITGIGKDSALMAVSYLFGRYHRHNEETGITEKISCFINIGTAGHKDLPIGEFVLSHKLSCPGKESYYPLILFKFDGTTKETITADLIEKSYEKDALYDMEAFFLMAAASRFLPFELTHFIKIVSDNLQVSALTVTGEDIEKMVHDNLDNIEMVLEKIKEIAAVHGSFSGRESGSYFFERWHFSQTEKHRLEDMLNRIKILSQDKNRLSFHLFSQCTSSKQVLETLEKEIRSFPIMI